MLFKFRKKEKDHTKKLSEYQLFMKKYINSITFDINYEERNYKIKEILDLYVNTIYDLIELITYDIYKNSDKYNNIFNILFNEIENLIDNKLDLELIDELSTKSELELQFIKENNKKIHNNNFKDYKYKLLYFLDLFDEIKYYMDELKNISNTQENIYKSQLANKEYFLICYNLYLCLEKIISSYIENLISLNQYEDELLLNSYTKLYEQVKSIKKSKKSLKLRL